MDGEKIFDAHVHRDHASTYVCSNSKHNGKESSTEESDEESRSEEGHEEGRSEEGSS
jgi:hypothetical protein